MDETLNRFERAIAQRARVVKAETAYTIAVSRAKNAKKDLDTEREIFDTAFDAAVEGQTEPPLPFDGIHQSDVVQPDNDAIAPENDAPAGDVVSQAAALADGAPADPTLETPDIDAERF